MNKSEFAACMKKAEALFCPKNDMFGGINEEQQKEFWKAWSWEPQDTVLEVISLAYQADPEYSRKRIMPPPSYFASFISNVHERKERSGINDQRGPEVSLAERKYQLFFARSMTALHSVKHRPKTPELLISRKFQTERHGYMSFADLFAFCWAEFGQHVRTYENFLKECNMIATGLGEAVGVVLSKKTNTDPPPAALPEPEKIPAVNDVPF